MNTVIPYNLHSFNATNKHYQLKPINSDYFSFVITGSLGHEAAKLHVAREYIAMYADMGEP